MRSLRNLGRRRMRTILTILGIAVAAGMFIALSSLGQGMYQFSRESITKGRRDIRLVPAGAEWLEEGYFAVGGIENAHQIGEELSMDARIRLASPTLTAVIFFRTIPQNVRSAAVTGIIPASHEDFLRSELTEEIEGGFEVKDDPYFLGGLWTGEIMVDSAMVKEMNLEIGDILQASAASDFSDLVEFKVVGIFDRPLSKMEPFIPSIGYVHLGELQAILGGDDVASTIDLALADPTSESRREVKNWLEETYPNLRAVTKEDEFTRLNDQVERQQWFSYAILTITFSIAILFVACVTMTSVSERRHEFGILRAIGFSRKTIFLDVIKEAFWLGTIGGFLGLGLGFVGGEALGYQFTTMEGIGTVLAVTTWEILLKGMIIAVTVCIGAALIPAWRSTKINIIEGLEWR